MAGIAIMVTVGGRAYDVARTGDGGIIFAPLGEDWTVTVGSDGEVWLWGAEDSPEQAARRNPEFRGFLPTALEGEDGLPFIRAVRGLRGV